MESVGKASDDTQLQELEKLNEAYKAFLDAGKTERECVTEIVRQAEAAGYRDLYSMDAVKAGDKVYATWMEKSIALFHVGSEPLEQGMNILGAHIDSPRLDLKQNPLYEDSGFAYFDTHYYGGIKKYRVGDDPAWHPRCDRAQRRNERSRIHRGKGRGSGICGDRSSCAFLLQTDGEESFRSRGG